MEETVFKHKLMSGLKQLDINISDKQLNLFWRYFNFLIKENKKYNLTAITDPEDVINKHFLDCLVIQTEVKFKKEEKMIDIGSGAGFPGIVLKIVNKDILPVLIESRLKRVNFLLYLISKLEIENEVTVIHGRAEDYGQDSHYREKYDRVVARAVASINTLAEYCLPFIKVGGECVLYKGPQYEKELEQAQEAINILGGEIKEVKMMEVPGIKAERSLIIINKKEQTPISYPRRAGIPKKRPL